VCRDSLEPLDATAVGAVRVGERATPRVVRLVSVSVKVDDPVRVTVAGVEVVEGRIEAGELSTLRVRVRRRLFSSTSTT
jgi:hypothetical protein